MILVFGLTRHTGVRLAEVGFLLIVIGGAWLAAAQIPQLKLGGTRAVVAGVALAVGGALLVVATHWGGFGAR
jgi:hypothetical protein